MDLTTAQSNLEIAQSAYRKALKAKSAGSLDYRVEYQDLAALRGEVDYWSRVVKDLTYGTSKPYAIARWTR